MQTSWFIGVPLVLLLVAVVPAYATQLSTVYLLKLKPRLLNLIVLIIGSLLVAAAADVAYNFVSLGAIQLSNEKGLTPAVLIFISQIVLFANFLRHPEIGAIGYANAFKVTALSMLIEIAALFALAFIFMGISNAHV